jgi:hypothetical protein
MIGVMAFLAVASWKVLDVLSWIGGSDARLVERWVGAVFAATILVPMYLFGDLRPLEAVVDEIVEPIIRMVAEHIERSTR